MKKVISILFIFFFLTLSADESSVWTSQPDWVTGPETEIEFYGNQMTRLLPFGIKVDVVLNGEDDDPENDIICWKPYIDEAPILFETDMGWPVPDENEENLKYLIFGDTHFFMRNSDGQIMNTITDENNVETQIFNVSDPTSSNAEISEHEMADAVKSFVKKPEDVSPRMSPIAFLCSLNCSDNECFKDCFASESFSNYSSCVSFCNTNGLESKLGTATDIPSPRCENFCQFAVIEAYSSAGYYYYYYYYSDFSEDSETSCSDVSNPDIFNTTHYNNGTSNIFLAASLQTTEENGDYTYKVKFEDTSETGENSHQLYEINSGNQRKSKSIWMSDLERDQIGTYGIYTRGYFYACAGSPGQGNTCDKKLFIPYGFGSWQFESKLIENIIKDPLYGPYVVDDSQFPVYCPDFSNNIYCLRGNKLYEELEHQTEKFGLGIYDFEEECRVKYSDDGNNNLSCPGESSDNGYPNINILWTNISKMSNTTVIHGPDIDPLSTESSDYDRYIYFMGTGETALTVDASDLTWAGVLDPDPDIKAIKHTQKAYIARVPAYESEIKNAFSYEYFSGTFNGIAKWSKNINAARPLYSFYPMESMGAESVVWHKGLYWMTAPLNETEKTAGELNEKGVIVLASPDMFHWQEMDKILFENPESIKVDYAFFWLPPGLIDEDDTSMPFLYSIWKSTIDTLPEPDRYHLKGFLDPDLDPKFTTYNLKTGKYNFMRNNKTGVFLVNDSVYGNLLTINIPDLDKIRIEYPPFSSDQNDPDDNDPALGYSSFSFDLNAQSFFNSNDGTTPLPFKGFQNIDQIGITGQDAADLKNRYVLVQYCDCGDETDVKRCKEEICRPYEKFLNEDGTTGGNWNTIEVSNTKNFKTNVRPCVDDENIPDYLCNIPFKHNEDILTGITSTPVWKWRHQIAKDTPNKEIEDIESANVILRFSHWYNIEYKEGNYTDINSQLVENNKIVPYDCEIYMDNNNNDPSILEKACQSPDSWRTTDLIHLKYEEPYTPEFPDYNPIVPPRFEYLYPYPIMIPDLGDPGDPYGLGNILVADHLTGNFYKTGGIEYGEDVVGVLPPGFAVTSVISENSMNVYAWGGLSSSMVLLNDSSVQIGPERILYSGSFNPETESVILEQSVLTETAGENSPSITSGASMVYDDVKGKIYLIGAVDKTGVYRIYRLDNITGGQMFTQGWNPIAEIDTGKYFRLVKKNSREYFVIGGIKTDGSFSTKVFLLNLDNVSSPQLLTTFPDSGLANSFSAYNEKTGKLYIYGGEDSSGVSDRFLSFDMETSSWNEINTASGPGAASGGVLLVNYVDETISLGGGKFEDPLDSLVKWVFNEESTTWTKINKDLELEYCLDEANQFLKGGLKVSGECVPFTHKWYNSFPAGANVYSVAGKGDRLYVGTDSHIIVYDISDPAAMTYVTEYSLSGERVYDLEVTENDGMYAATSGGIYRFDISDPDMISLINSFSTGYYNYQYRIQLYNDLLYVGDDYGINIRDKETFALISYVDDGAMLDFTISEGKIALYSSAFLSSNIQVRDADSLNLLAWEYADCYTGELTSDHGEFYLTCDGYDYRFEIGSGTYLDFYTLEANILELQENYLNNGWVYIPDGSNIKLSTNNDVPSLCGNGIIEPGELCDGNSVACTSIDPDYYGGTAYCNSTCDGYNEDSCETDDGW